MDRWMHDSFDIICFGRSYWWLHREIDKKAKELGIHHRIYNHDWYWEFKKRWDFEDPFPLGELDKELSQIIESVPKTLRSRFEAMLKQEISDLSQKGLVKEAFQVYVCHCFWDRMWNEYSTEERQRLKQFAAVWMLSPQLLYEKAGVDVIEGKMKIKTDGEQWEDNPSLKTDYANLVEIIRGELDNRPERRF